jgi:hypothetical protein
MATRTETDVSAEREEELDTELSRLSLEQALVDFEIANARVVDLTQRLVAAGEEIAELRREVEVLRAEKRERDRQVEVLSRSRALRLAAAARGVVRAVRR